VDEVGITIKETEREVEGWERRPKKLYKIQAFLL
jgi:hypothetical protein